MGNVLEGEDEREGLTEDNISDEVGEAIYLLIAETLRTGASMKIWRFTDVTYEDRPVGDFEITVECRPK